MFRFCGTNATLLRLTESFQKDGQTIAIRERSPPRSGPIEYSGGSSLLPGGDLEPV